MATILVVDDSSTARALIVNILAERGHKCLEAGDGAEGVALAKKQRPALVLMDVVMGEHDGFKACRQLKRDPSTKDIPVVLVTCKTGESDEMWGRKMGAADYLRKPISQDALIEAVNRLIP